MIIGSYSNGSASAIEYSTVDELLTQLPDNEVNLILAQDIRDSVYTLWNRISTLDASLTASLSASVYFQNPNPVPITIGGIEAGSTFPEPTDMQTMWDRLLYPYIDPLCSLFPNQIIEYGNPNGLVNPVTFNWAVTRNTDPITFISVDGISYIPTGESQTGTHDTIGTHSWTGAGASEVNTFDMFVRANGNEGTSGTAEDSATITWMNNLYWGSIDLGGVNLTTNPELITQVVPICDDSAILGLQSQLSSSKNKSYNGIDGNGDHLIFAWPSSVSGATSPTFTVNGLPNTAFTRVRTASPFVNVHGFTTNYEVWVSNTVQNSPIDLFSIS